MLRRPLHRWTLVAGVVTALACDGAVEPTDDATLIVRAEVSATSVATVVVEITAPDILTPLVFNIPVVDGIVAGTIVVPAGSHRTIAMRAYDAEGVKTHSGSTVVTIQPGTNPTITLTMQPLTGELPLTVSLGSITVNVTPSTLELGPGLTGQLAVSVTDWNGQVVSGTILWATSDPGVATVDATGFVTAVRAGSTHIVATFQGAAGRAAVTVTP